MAIDQISNGETGVAIRTKINAAISAINQIGSISYSLSTHDHPGVYEPADATILKDADIGLTVANHNHSHAEYSVTGHLHTGTYSLIDHNHTGTYSLIDHNHTGVYSLINHNHTGVYEPADATILKDADIDHVVQRHNANTIIGDGSILSIVSLTQAEYDALTPKIDTTLYIIQEE